jgi:hypothetical protein
MLVTTVKPHVPDIPQEQIDRIQQILDQVLGYLRAQSQKLPPEAGLAVTYELQPEGDQ